MQRGASHALVLPRVLAHLGADFQLGDGGALPERHLLQPAREKDAGGWRGARRQHQPQVERAVGGSNVHQPLAPPSLCRRQYPVPSAALT